MSLEVSMYIKQDTVFTRFKGELDEMSVTDIRTKLNEILNKYDVKNIVFNLHDLNFMDSSGIGMIIGRYNQVKDKKGKIILCDLNSNIERIIVMSGLLKICTLRDTESSARWFLGV